MDKPDRLPRKTPSFSRDLLLCMIVLILCVVGFLTANDYLYTKSNFDREAHLLQVQTEQNILESIRLKDAIWSSYDASLNDKMEEGLIQVHEEYIRAGNDPSRMDLDRLKKAFGPDIDIYIINKDGVIAYTTFAPELGMDFSTSPPFFKYLTKIRNSEGFFPDRIVNELMGEGKFRKYAYMPTADHNYLLELGLTGRSFENINEKLVVNPSIDKIIAVNPYVTGYRVFNSVGRLTDDNSLPEDEVQKILAEVIRTRSAAERTDPGNAITRRYILVDLKDETYGSDPSRIIEITYSHRMIQDSLNQLLLFHLIIGTLAILLGCIIAYFLSRRLIRPVEGIVSDVDKISRGDLDHRIRPTENREFAILESSINTMVDSLKAAFQKMKDDEIFKKEMIEQLPVGIFLKEVTTGRYLFWNKSSEELFRIPASTILGKTDRELFPPDIAAIIENEDWQLCQKPWDAQNRIIRHGQHSGRLIHLITVIILDSQGKLQFILGICEDVSHENINIKLDLLFSITRQEILDNLSAIMNHLERAQLKKTHEETQTFFETTLGSIESIKNHIASMRTLQNFGLLSPRWYRLQDTFSEAALLLSKNSAEVSVTTGTVEVFADPLFPRICFLLLEHSVNSRGPGSLKIQVTVSRAGDTLHIMYKDSGLGVPKEDKERIFDAGYDTGTDAMHRLFLIRELLALTGITIHEIGIFGKGNIFDIQVPKEKFRDGKD